MNVSRVYRLLKLITLLRSGRSYDSDGLARELDVSRRTLFRDLKLLEHAGVPYAFNRKTNQYAISDTFFLPALHLTLDEALALLLVTRKFLSSDVHPAYRQAMNAALKVESTLPAPVLGHCGDWLSDLSIRWEPSSSVDATSRVFEQLQQALAEHIRIRVQYDSVKDGCELTLLLDPRRLVFMTRGWYLLAKSHQHDEVRTFKVDRIVTLELTEDRFEPDERFSEEAHFGKAWRMIPEGKVHPIKLRFSARVAATVEEVQWHATQTTQHLDDGGLLFEAEVDGLSEITSWILGYGEHVEVLAPTALRDRLREKAEAIVRLAARR